MSNTNKIILAIIVILAIAGIYYYMQPGYNSYNYNYPTPSPSPYASYSPEATYTPAESPTPSPMASPSASVKPSPSASVKPSSTPTPRPVTYNISATEFKYNPNAITAKAGQAVTIVFSNKGTIPHNLTLENPGIATQTINPGKTATIQFTAPAAGTYTFFCSVDSHRNLGLTGTLTVQ